jgi:hypothetical protein
MTAQRVNGTKLRKVPDNREVWEIQLGLLLGVSTLTANSVEEIVAESGLSCDERTRKLVQGLATCHVLDCLSRATATTMKKEARALWASRKERLKRLKKRHVEIAKGLDLVKAARDYDLEELESFYRETRSGSTISDRAMSGISA